MYFVGFDIFKIFGGKIRFYFVFFQLRYEFGSQNNRNHVLVKHTYAVVGNLLSGELKRFKSKVY